MTPSRIAFGGNEELMRTDGKISSLFAGHGFRWQRWGFKNRRISNDIDGGSGGSGT